MKYPKTWKAIDAAIKQSSLTGLTEYLTINNLVAYMREYPHDAELLEWNLVVCAGHEMIDDLKAPIWNSVLDVWHGEKHKDDAVRWNQINVVARETKERL